jgi:hypothetical protein
MIKYPNRHRENLVLDALKGAKLRYKWIAKGTAAHGQTWETSGYVEGAREGDFPIVLQQAMMQSFEQLTGGKAIFGLPGIGCHGPYSISKFSVEKYYE